jgi:hypothetical protein
MDQKVSHRPLTVIGNQKRVLVIRTDFSDLPGDPQWPWSNQPGTAAAVQAVADTEISTYYRNSSYGRSGVVFTVSPQLYRLPQTAANYATVSLEFVLYADALAVAQADYTVANYDIVVVLFSWLGNYPGSKITFGGESEIGTSMVMLNGDFDFRAVAHELGHAYGLYHANRRNTSDGNPISDARSSSSIEYGDLFDTMGANYGDDHRTDFNPWFKYLLHWISDDQVQTVTTNGTYRVYRFDDPAATGTLALKIRRDSYRSYWVGCRRSFTENPTMQHGAYVVWGYPWAHQSDLLCLGATPNSARDAALVIGESLADPEANLTITPVAEGGEAPAQYLDVQVTFGSPPMIAAQPEAQQVLEGQDAQFAVVAAGNPVPNYRWQRQPSGSSDWVNLSDGPDYSGTDSSALLVRNASIVMDGDAFRCILTSSDGGFNSSRPAVLSVSQFGIATFAGQPGLPGQEDGFGSQAQFNSPMGIAIDQAGNTYVADSGNHIIRKISPAGLVSTWAGLAGSPGTADGTASNARFNFPVGVAVDMGGNLYVTDQNNSTIRKITPDGTVATLAGAPGSAGSSDGIISEARFNHPSGVAADCFGNLYVADTGNQTVRKIAPDGAVSTLAGLTGTPGAADGTGNTARFSVPAGIAVDLAGNVYVADQQNSAIRKITAEGQVTTLAGSSGSPGNIDGLSTSARFSSPAGLAVDVWGALYVADQTNSTIRKITSQGLVSTLAGAVLSASAGTGTNTGVQFSYPAGVAVDSQGTVYVADTAANAIRIIRSGPTPPPSLQMSVVAGQLILSWPTSATGFVLEARSALSPDSLWSPVNNQVGTFGCSFVVTNSMDAPASFFRLHKQ